MNSTNPPSVNKASYYVIRPMYSQYSDSETKTMMACGPSLKLDRYGNLFFVEAKKKMILKVDNSELEKMFALPPRANMSVIRINLTASEVYSSNTTKYITNIGSMALEREYLYCTNTNQHAP